MSDLMGGFVRGLGAPSDSHPPPVPEAPAMRDAELISRQTRVNFGQQYFANFVPLWASIHAHCWDGRVPLLLPEVCDWSCWFEAWTLDSDPKQTRQLFIGV
jgi:hypothetical protein